MKERLANSLTWLWYNKLLSTIETSDALKHHKLQGLHKTEHLLKAEKLCTNSAEKSVQN